MKPVHARAAFTLIELLVVTAVICLLAAILLPSLKSSRSQGRQAACMANLRQWATAAIMYASENFEYLPRRGQGVQPTTVVNRPEDWFNALPAMLQGDRYIDLFASGRVPRPGARGVWMCPDAEPTSGVNYFAYAMNMWLSTWIAAQPDRIDRVGPPATMVFLTDGPGTHCSTLPSDQSFGAAARHAAKLPIAFLDQHVTAYRGEYVGCGTGIADVAAIRWKAPGSVWAGP